MQYKRFLTDNDYMSIMTEEGFCDIIRGRHSRVIQAEKSAEMAILEYLKQNFKIEEVFAKGKFIADYNPQITYPAGVYLKKDGNIYKTLLPINGVKQPASHMYWREMTDEDVEFSKTLDSYVPPYSQMETYKVGDIVLHQSRIWICQHPNGIDFQDIRIPGIMGWSEKSFVDFEPVMPYPLWQVVRYEGKFYTLMSLDNLDNTLNPYDSDNWGLIGDYKEDYNYELSEHEYVVYDNKVFYPTINVNGDTPEEHKNIIEDDPRNPNIIRHMLRIAIYELHKLISPTNISQVRINDYNESIQWLKDASHLKLDPQIERKIDERDNTPVTNFEVATFAAPLDPWQNEWII